MNEDRIRKALAALLETAADTASVILEEIAIEIRKGKE